MPLKAISTTVTALGLVDNTNIANTDSQVVTIGQLQAIINQLTSNRQVLENKIAELGISKVKMPSVKRFSSKKAKFKGFLTQMKLKIRHKGVKLPIVADQVAYIGLFLTRHTLKWFKLYLIKYKANGLTTRNNKVKYIFLS